MKRWLPLALLLPACACWEGGARQPAQQEPSREALIRVNRDAMRLEDRDIALYAQRQGLATVKSATGVHVQLLRDAPGEAVRPEQLAVVNYRLELLDGAVAYATEAGKPESFRVGHDDVESGLHEAIQQLSPGDSAIIIIPSYRAHGLIGDQERIPPRSSVVYRIGLVRVVP
jgi:FKBP-type peptidyl-prolyl cis-trans isomerase